MTQDPVGFAQAKFQHLIRRLAERGETVLVTDRDRVVAEIVPSEKTRSPVLADALLAEAVRQGWITPPVLKSPTPAPRNPVMSLRELKTAAG